MEYTDAPSAQTETPIPEQDAQGKLATAEGQASDAVAVLLSVIPGLGHIYKGHKVIGLLLMFVGTITAVALALLTATFTAGFGVLVLPIYWIAVMMHVYAIQDRVSPGANDEGEEY